MAEIALSAQNLKHAKFGYCALTFVNTAAEELTQLENTVIMQEAYRSAKRFVPLGSALKKSQYGFTASAKDSGKIKLVRITDINAGNIEWDTVPYCDCKEYAKYAISTGDILIARTGGTTGKTVMLASVPHKSIFASYLIRLTVDTDKFEPEFVYLFLNSYLFWNQILEMKNGTAQPNVNAEKMKGLLIPDTPLPLQQEIVKFKKNKDLKLAFSAVINSKFQRLSHLYSQLKEISAETTTQSGYLTQLRQAILQEAIEGKLTAEWRRTTSVGSVAFVRDETNDAAVLLEKIKQEKMALTKSAKSTKKEKELPPIEPAEVPFALPEGWAWTRLGEITTIKGGKRVDNGYKLLKTPTKHIYIRVSDMKNGQIDDTDLHYIDDRMFEKIKQYIIRKEDIYMTIVGGTIGKCGLVPDKFDNMNLTENAARIILYLTDKFFLFNCLRSEFCQRQFIDKTKQVGVQKMALNRFASSLIPVPPLAEQHAIVERVDRLLAMVDQLEQQVAERKVQAEELMQAVLREAFG